MRVGWTNASKLVRHQKHEATPGARPVSVNMSRENSDPFVRWVSLPSHRYGFGQSNIPLTFDMGN